MSHPVRADLEFKAASCYTESVRMILKTTDRIAIATVASKVVLLPQRLARLGSMVNTERMGIQWCLDLREGIDFISVTQIPFGNSRRTQLNFAP